MFGFGKRSAKAEKIRHGIGSIEVAEVAICELYGVDPKHHANRARVKFSVTCCIPSLMSRSIEQSAYDEKKDFFFDCASMSSEFLDKNMGFNELRSGPIKIEDLFFNGISGRTINFHLDTFLKNSVYKSGNERTNHFGAFGQLMNVFGNQGIKWVFDRRDNWHAYSLFCRDIILGNVDESDVRDFAVGIEVHGNLEWLSEQF